MSTLYTYPVPVPTSDNNTITRYRNLPIRTECFTDLLDDPCCGFNFIKCPEDKEYYQPVCVYDYSCNELRDCVRLNSTNCSETDILFFQFQQPDQFNDWFNAPPTHGWSPTKTGNWLATLEIIAPTQFRCTAQYSDYVLAAHVGALQDGRRFQQIAINPGALPPLFYIKFTFNIGGAEVVAYTEPYKRVTCEATFKVEGVYPAKGRSATDCSKYYYGDLDEYLGLPFRYRNVMRVPGTVEPHKYNISRDESDNGKVLSTTRNWYNRLRTRKIPAYVAERMSDLFMAPTITIDNEDFKLGNEVLKNNEIGTMWLLDFELEREERCTTQEYNCQ